MSHHLNGRSPHATDPREDARPADEPAGLVAAVALVLDLLLWAFLTAACAVGAVWFAGVLLRWLLEG